MDKETIIIFGASGGIGSKLATILSEREKRVILCSRNQVKLEQLAKDLNQPYIVCDGTSENEVHQTIDKAFKDYGKIDGVVNCIGSFFIKPIAQATFKEYEEVLRINLTSSFAILKEALPKMNDAKNGSLVFVSSCAAQIGLMHHEVIAAAKGAIEALVRSAAASYAQKGIRINAVAPGLVDTPLSNPITSNESALKGSIGFHPMGRIGLPEDIAYAIAWLLSHESSWITGQTISVDGGLSHIKIKNS